MLLFFVCFFFATSCVYSLAVHVPYLDEWALQCLALLEWDQWWCTDLFHTFSPDLLDGSVTLLNRKTRSDHCSSQFFSQGHGSGTVWILTAAASIYGNVQRTQGQRLMLVRHSYCKNMGCFNFHQSYTKKSAIHVSLRNSRHTLSPWRLQCCTQLHGCPQVNICSCSFVGNHKEVQLLRQPYPSQYKRPWQGH